MMCASFCFCFFYSLLLFFFFNDTATTEIYTLSLHDALPISRPTIVPWRWSRRRTRPHRRCSWSPPSRSCCPTSKIGRDTSELQSRRDLVCRLLLEKKKKTKKP